MLAIEVKEHLGVATRPEPVSPRAQLLSQRLEVEDLAVVDDRDLAVLGEHRLVAALEVDDLEPPVVEMAAGPAESAPPEAPAAEAPSEEKSE